MSPSTHPSRKVTNNAIMTTPTVATPPLLLTIRFSASLPDLDLDIPRPQSTTVLSLKHLLRTRLSTRNRLRLIYRGRILPDSSALGSVLKPPLQPSPPPPPPPSSEPDAKGKGKAIDGHVAVRIYVNCSIGDELTPEELADEQASASRPPPRDVAPAESSKPAASTRPRPTGFDRLLQAGFTSSEISTLRTQFASIQNERFAPDSMPSPDSLRRLEDAWIDTNAGELPSAASPLEDELSSMSTVLDVLIRGTMIGFFFPLGSITWLLRQGLWSEKWQIFVGSGVVLSVTVGIVMSISSER